MRNLEIVRTPDGGITLKAKVTHGPGDLHTLALSKDDVGYLRRQARSYHDSLHRSEEPALMGIETLDADLLDFRKKKWAQTEIHGDFVGSEANEESLKGL